MLTIHPSLPEGFRFLTFQEKVQVGDMVALYDYHETKWSVWFEVTESPGNWSHLHIGAQANVSGLYTIDLESKYEWCASRKISPEEQLDFEAWELSGIVYSPSHKPIPHEEIEKITEEMLDVVRKHGMLGGMGGSPIISQEQGGSDDRG
jgi:hypothetical protein